MSHTQHSFRKKYNKGLSEVIVVLRQIYSTRNTSDIKRINEKLILKSIKEDKGKKDDM